MAIAPICSAREPVRVAIDHHHLCCALIIADRAAINPTGPAPAITTLSPGITPAISVAW